MLEQRSEDYVAAAIVWCIAEQHPDFKKGQSILQIQLSLERIFLVMLDVELVEAALSILCNHGAVSPISDEFTQEYYYFDEIEARNLFVLKSENAESPFNKVQLFGYDWIQEAFENIAKKFVSFSFNLGVETLSTVKADVSVPVEWNEVPASDRMININHNSPDFKKVEQDIDILEDTVRADNTFGANQPDIRDAIVAELRGIKVVLKSDYIRPSTVRTFILGTLVYLAEKFANSPIEAMAKTLWESLSKLLDFGV